ncbi:hypothetical protein G4O51_10680 [Candidatus Bathyarchaeota archaeon A05DMB-2]|jgi:hypothetical protein|nr:hypothetical protein [Candidatus Bathyarchaeota archaeon A05DMB-2]MBT0160435.1 hypothetical protein [Candidatus Bathyarchaeota archaeon A05DMB-2]
MDKQIEFLIKLRDGCLMIADAANEYLDSLAPPEVKEKKQATAVQEVTFTTLRFEPQQGAKLGDFEVAYRQNNLADKWSSAYSILRNSNATIKDRYHGDGYQHSYWLYGEDKIYRQKLKPKT